VDIVSTEGEVRTRDNMERKAIQAEQMFSELVKHMNASQKIDRKRLDVNTQQLPTWLKGN